MRLVVVDVVAVVTYFVITTSFRGLKNSVNCGFGSSSEDVRPRRHHYFAEQQQHFFVGQTDSTKDR